MITSKTQDWVFRRGGGKACHIQKNAPDFCQVTVICEGKEVMGEMISSPYASSIPNISCCRTKSRLQDEEQTETTYCTCFSKCI